MFFTIQRCVHEVVVFRRSFIWNETLASVGNMIQFTKLFLVTTAVVQSGDYHLRTVVRRHYEINETYIVDDGGYTFNETVK